MRTALRRPLIAIAFGLLEVMILQPLIAIKNLHLETNGGLGSCCKEVQIQSLELFRGQPFFVAGDSRQGKGALCSALDLLLHEYGNHPGTYSSIRIEQEPHEGRPRKPVQADSIQVAQPIRLARVTDLNMLPERPLDADTVVLCDDPGQPAVVLPAVLQHGVTLLVASEPDRLALVMRELAGHSESQFVWLRCGHAYCGPMPLVDFCQSSEEYLGAYCPPCPGQFKDVVGALRDGVSLWKENADAHR